MNRYTTKKEINGHTIYTEGTIKLGRELFSMGMQKLGQLEDIEQELGIGLITLFKATFAGVYYITNGQVINTKDVGFSVAFCKDYLLIIDSEIEHSYHIKDYGKTWALTKEELEN